MISSKNNLIKLFGVISVSLICALFPALTAFAAPPPTPNATIDFTQEKLIGLEQDRAHYIWIDNRGVYVLDHAPDGTINIRPNWFRTTIHIEAEGGGGL